MHTTLIIDDEHALLFETFIAILYNFEKNGELIVAGDRNTIKKFKVGDTEFSIKKFKNPNLFQSLVYRFLRKSKARRSYEYGKKLITLGIKTPKPIAYAETFKIGLKESYYICEHLNYDFDFRVLNHNPKWPNRKEILEQMAAFTYKLHEAQVHFMDHSPGNTLIVEKEKGQYNFYLIDLNRIRFEALSFHQRMKNFRRLWLSKTMINIMAPVYAKLNGKTEAETHKLMTLYSRKFQRKVNSKKLRRRRRKS